MVSFTPETLQEFVPYRDAILNRIRTHHIRRNPGHDGRLFLISDTYPGYWLEHLYDAICWATLHPEDRDIAESQLRLFLENQSADGQLPSHILDNSLLCSIPGLCKAYTGFDVLPDGLHVCYGQIQECVGVARLCLHSWQAGQGGDLAWYYERCCKWDGWLCANRMTRGLGLVETFCGYDTGHDNSGRLQKFRYPCELSTAPGGYPENCPVAPVISPDINAVLYGNRIALAKMAAILGRSEEQAAWEQRAAAVKAQLLALCYDPEEEFFYDLDRNGQHIKVKSVSITTLFAEDAIDPALGKRIWERYLADPRHFGTPWGFPGASLSDPTCQPILPGNCWGYFAQGNVALRTTLWMERWGFEEDYRRIMAAWLHAWCRPGILPFGQELDPITGVPSACSAWYSTTMLYLLCAMQTFGLTV